MTTRSPPGFHNGPTQAGGGHPHQNPVHPHGAGADLAPQPGGAELEAPGEPADELIVVSLDQSLDLGSSIRIGIDTSPAPRQLDHIGAAPHRSQPLQHTS